MNRIAKLAIVMTLAGGTALAAMPAQAAGVSIGIGLPGIGVGVGAPPPAYGPGPCADPNYRYYNPGYCGAPPTVGVFVNGRGYWDGHGWYGHRYRDHGGWHY